MSQIWAQTAAYYYGLNNVHTFSGGTQATACNCRTVAAMRRVGFAIEDATTGDNPVYLVRYADIGLQSARIPSSIMPMPIRNRISSR